MYILFKNGRLSANFHREVNTMITNRFDKSKALEVLLYVTHQTQDMYHTAKIIYFANRYHLEKYGRFIIDDRVIAMKHGPVLSNLYDMI